MTDVRNTVTASIIRFFFSSHWKTSSCLDNPKVSAAIGFRSSESWMACWLFTLGRWARYATILRTGTRISGRRASDGPKSHEKHGKMNIKQFFPIACNKRTMKYSLNVQTGVSNQEIGYLLAQHISVFSMP